MNKKADRSQLSFFVRHFYRLGRAPLEDTLRTRVFEIYICIVLVGQTSDVPLEGSVFRQSQEFYLLSLKRRFHDVGRVFSILGRRECQQP